MPLPCRATDVLTQRHPTRTGIILPPSPEATPHPPPRHHRPFPRYQTNPKLAIDNARLLPYNCARSSRPRRASYRRVQVCPPTAAGNRGAVLWGTKTTSLPSRATRRNRAQHFLKIVPSLPRTAAGLTRDFFFMRFLPHLDGKPRASNHFRALRAVAPCAPSSSASFGGSIVSGNYETNPPSIRVSAVHPHPRSSASICGSTATTKRTQFAPPPPDQLPSRAGGP